MKGVFYGFNIHGIQAYLGESKLLKEIVGASELVEYICKVLPKKVMQDLSPQLSDQEYQMGLIQSAAGQFRYIFSNQDLLETFVAIFPMEVEKTAAGIGLAQACYQLVDDIAPIEALKLLEERLRAQRNKPFEPAFANPMVVRNSRRDGTAALWREKDHRDRGTRDKLRAFDQFKKMDDLLPKAFPGYEKLRMASDFKDIAEQDSWLAVVHIDGNDLGSKKQSLIEGAREDGYLKLKDFSEQLEQATERAFTQTLVNWYGVIEAQPDQEKVLPFRLLILGGDDLTFVCKAKDAVQFAQDFIAAFHVETKKITGFTEGLSACAGIAYMKKSFPFYYGLELAELLCKKSKEIGRQIGLKTTPSSLLFHKIQSSFVSDLEDLINLEYKVNKSLSFFAGPYHIEQHNIDGLVSLRELLHSKRALESDKALRNRIREWMSYVLEEANSQEAQMLQSRMVSRYKSSTKDMINTLHLNQPFRALKGFQAKPVEYSEYFDLLTLLSLES